MSRTEKIELDFWEAFPCGLCSHQLIGYWIFLRSKTATDTLETDSCLPHSGLNSKSLQWSQGPPWSSPCSLPMLAPGWVSHTQASFLPQGHCTYSVPCFPLLLTLFITCLASFHRFYFKSHLVKFRTSYRRDKFPPPTPISSAYLSARPELRSWRRNWKLRGQWEPR